MAGRSPFENTNPARVMAGHLSEVPPPLTTMRTDLPRTLDPVLARALAKQPGEPVRDLFRVR